jgi:DNA-binding MarR family transcriptional regulator
MHEAICIETWQDPLPLDQFLTYRLARVQARLNVQAAVLLKRHAGLTLSQWRIIALIGSGGHTKVSDFTRSMGLDKGLVSRNVRLLVEKGLVASARDTADLRVQRLRLTRSGQALFEQTLPKMRERQRYLRAALDPSELAVLYGALVKLEAAAEWREAHQ